MILINQLKMVVIAFFLFPISVYGQNEPFSTSRYQGKKILYINSYHAGLEWSDGITRGIQQVLKNTGVQLKIVYMGARHHPPGTTKPAIALSIKAIIEEFNPDVVITSDNAAAEYVIMPHYKNATLPFVFCGINWDASIYGLPYQNVTGMVEVDFITTILKHLREYAKGDKIGFIAPEGFSTQNYVENYTKRLKIAFTQTYFVKTFQEWKQRYLELQQQVDMLILFPPESLVGWDEAQMASFIAQNTLIPSGAVHAWLMPYVLLGIAKVPEEQGTWAAQTALKILAGTSPSEIPLTKNKQGKLFINLRLGNKLGIFFKLSLLKSAEIIR